MPCFCFLPESARGPRHLVTRAGPLPCVRCGHVLGSWLAHHINTYVLCIGMFIPLCMEYHKHIESMVAGFRGVSWSSMGVRWGAKAQL